MENLIDTIRKEFSSFEKMESVAKSFGSDYPEKEKELFIHRMKTLAVGKYVKNTDKVSNIRISGECSMANYEAAIHITDIDVQRYSGVILIGQSVIVLKKSDNEIIRVEANNNDEMLIGRSIEPDDIWETVTKDEYDTFVKKALDDIVEIAK